MFDYINSLEREGLIKLGKKYKVLGYLSDFYNPYLSDNELRKSVISKIEEEPNAGWIEFNRPGYGLPLLGGEKFLRKIKPEPGLVILFPSYVWHGTIPFSTGGERISIAFDVHI